MSYLEARIYALEAANQELKIQNESLKLQLLKIKVQDPNYDKPLSEININYEIVNKSNELICFCGSRKVNTTGGLQCPNNRCILN
jgi:hypothetical protein